MATSGSRLKTSDVQFMLDPGDFYCYPAAALKAYGLLQNIFQPVPQTSTTREKFTAQDEKKKNQDKYFTLVVSYDDDWYHSTHTGILWLFNPKWKKRNIFYSVDKITNDKNNRNFFYSMKQHLNLQLSKF